MGVLIEQAGPLNVGGLAVFVEATLTRPADTTQYTAADQVAQTTTAGSNHLLQFKNCVREPGGTGILYSGLMFDSVDAATNPNFSLVLFNTLDITMAADNAAAAVIDDQIRSVVAGLVFDGTMAEMTWTVGANLIILNSAPAQAFKCADGSRDLYGIVVDRGAYTPASAEQFRFRLGIIQD